jgi:hypothetical protein
MAETYIPDSDYAKLVAALASLAPCPMAGRVTEDQIKTALGDVGDIWPESYKVEFIEDGASLTAR